MMGLHPSKHGLLLKGGNPAFLSAPAVPPVYGHVVSNKGADLAENDHFSCLGETSALFPSQVG